MPINPNIPLQAANIPQIRYQPESQFESFAKIQPTLNAMQQMRTQALESQEKMAQRQALQKMRQDLMAAGKSGDLGMYAQALIGSGDARLMELGARINQGLMEEQAAERSLAPFRGQPVTRESVQNMLRAGGAAARAGEQLRQTLPTTPAEVETARAFGFQQTPEGYSAMKGAGRAEAQGPEIVQLMRARDALPAGSPDRALVQARIDRLNAPPAPAATVNLNQRLEGREQAAKGELNVAQYKDIVTAANVARRTLPALETQQRVLDEGFRTGFGTEAQKVGASVLSALGVPEAEKFASNAQVFISAMNQAVLQRQLEQKGPQTEADAQRITATGAQLGNTVEANKFIIAVAKAQLKRDLQQRQFWDAYWNKNQTYEGVEQAWESGAGGKSLFDMPELSAYAKPAPRPQSGRGAATGQRPASGVDRSNPLLQ